MTPIRTTSLLPPMKWNAWGDPAAAKPLSDGIRTLLDQALGVDGTTTPPSRRPTRCSVRPSALSRRRPRRAGGHRRRRHTASPTTTPDCCAPAASPPWTCCAARTPESRTHPTRCCCPADDDEIAAILRATAPSSSIAVVPFGGGTSVVGGLDPIRGDFKAVVSLDLRRLDALHGLDEVSGEAELGAGVTGPDAERLLGEHGFSLGHFPQSFQFATIGGFAATRSSGQDSAGYGRFDDMVRGLRVVTPAGVLDLGRAPASAAGPDLRQLFVGSEGVFGVITRVRVRVHPVPETTRYEAWSFPDFATGAAALRAVVQTGTGPTVHPAVRRGRDRRQPGHHRATSASRASPAAAWRSPCSRAPPRTPRAGTPRPGRVLEAHGGTSLGEEPARAWEHGRFDAPYLRDSLLAAGALCETLETATNWSNLADAEGRGHRGADDLAGRNRHTGAGAVPHFACVSHRRLAVLHRRRRAARQPDRAVAQGEDRRVATRSSRAGGTITHHHAVGADHRPWMRDEVGDLGVEVLRAVKAALDPAGILNPGKLIP